MMLSSTPIWHLPSNTTYKGSDGIVPLLDFFSNNSDACILSKIFDPDESVSNGDDRFGGVTILVRRDTSFKRISYVSSADWIAIRSSNLRPKTVIASVYFPPRIEIHTFRDEIYRLCDFFNGFPNFFLGGDFNARHPLYGNPLTSNLGKGLVNLISLSSFRCLNDGFLFFRQSSHVK